MENRRSCSRIAASNPASSSLPSASQRAPLRVKLAKSEGVKCTECSNPILRRAAAKSSHESAPLVSFIIILYNCISLLERSSLLVKSRDSCPSNSESGSCSWRSKGSQRIKQNFRECNPSVGGKTPNFTTFQVPNLVRERMVVGGFLLLASKVACIYLNSRKIV
mmetsp:Transcript_52350/g.136922  ORF Transcript_52350/g.136922 Transcript_52350/m.136922 type:complete len:164 (-) Transcript_52350:1300-1791(-)